MVNLVLLSCVLVHLIFLMVIFQYMVPVIIALVPIQEGELYLVQLSQFRNM